jgi:hypothetical protein
MSSLGGLASVIAVFLIPTQLKQSRNAEIYKVRQDLYCKYVAAHTRMCLNQNPEISER